MSSSTQRPVYIPKTRRRNNNTSNTASSGIVLGAGQRKRAQQLPRFHGAFTGGFSAGHFNTVATKEGWKPSTTKTKEQLPEDFMDEEDHAEWGGPTRIREDFAGSGNHGRSSRSVIDDNWPASFSAAPILGLESILEIKHETVGPRLLRHLGWRDTGTAFVPDDTDTAAAKGDDQSEISKIHLSKRRLRQIQLQTNRTKLPPPKLDRSGLGFEPLKDAPEFQRYHKRRKQQAKDRVTYNQRDNIYRISDVAVTNEVDSMSAAALRKMKSDNNQSQINEYLSYETAEDFVGKRSATGFALRDDEDDAYDHQQSSRGDRTMGKMTSRDLGDEFNTEIYEHESSDDEQMDASSTPPQTSSKISATPKPSSSNLFAAWAGGDLAPNADKTKGPSDQATLTTLTSSGHRPLSGFVLGSSMTNAKRYPGPDIPRNYEVSKHMFGENEHSQVFQALSRALKLQKEDEAESARRQEERQKKQQEEKARPQSSTFSSLADAMKSRFISGSSASTNKISSTQQEEMMNRPAGLYQPDPFQKKSIMDDNTPPPEKLAAPIIITRTVHSFMPDPLVCKRLSIPVPQGGLKQSHAAVAVNVSGNEATYFEKEIMAAATRQQEQESKQSPPDLNQSQSSFDHSAEVDANERAKGVQRPSIDRLKAIFEGESDGSSSGEEEAKGESDIVVAVSINQKKNGSQNLELTTTSKDKSTNEEEVGQELVEYRCRKIAQLDDGSRSDKVASDSDSSSHRQEKKKHRRKDHKRKKHKRRHSRSPVSDGERHRRRKKEKRNK